MRPVFLHTDQRIEGLVFITLVALLARALLRLRCQQAGLKVSADRVLAEFAPWSIVDLTLTDGSHLRQVSTPTEFQSQVMTALGVPPYERYRGAVIGGRWAIQTLEGEGRPRWSKAELRPAVLNAVRDHRAALRCISLIVRVERDALWLGC